MDPFFKPLAGGILIGLATWLVLASLGRVTGISGITSSALFENAFAAQNRWRWSFLLGLIAGGAVFASLLNTSVPTARSSSILVVAGLLVGFGTLLGSGCTSGHGVCGLGRRSLRSLTATCIFMTAGALTVWIAK